MSASNGASGRSPLRVCMVHYSDFHIDSRIQRQSRALAERGDEVHLVCLSPDGEVRVGAGRIVIHGISGDKAGGGAKAYLGGYARFFAHALVCVSKLDVRKRFDVVEAHNMPDFLTFTALLPKLRGTPVILNVHDTFPELFASKFGCTSDDIPVRLLEREEELSARFADAVITVTAEAGELLNSRGVGVARTHVVMNTPDERLFGPLREPAVLPDGPLRAIYHGGLAHRFGVELLIRAIGSLRDRLPGLSLRVCGTGDEHARLAAVAEEAAPDLVDLAPKPVPLGLIPTELERSHIGVVPTLRDRFTEHLLPVKLLEYVHMGLPAVAPRLPVIGRYFSDDEIRFFEPGSEADLAHAICDVCEDREAAATRAARAAARLAEIGWDRQRRHYVGLVDGLVARQGDKRGMEVRASRLRSSGGVPARHL